MKIPDEILNHYANEYRRLVEYSENHRLGVTFRPFHVWLVMELQKDGWSV